MFRWLTWRSGRAVWVGCMVIGLAFACRSPAAQKRSPEGGGSLFASPPPELTIPGGGDPEASHGSGFGAGSGDPPQASDNYVFVANPGGRSVVVIDSRELTIRSIDTGSSPSYLRAIPGAEAAMVLNVGSGDASVVRVADDGSLSARRVPVVKGANAISIAPDGQHAVVYFDADAGIAGNDFGDFQSVSVVSLEPGAETSTTMAVGFKPERVAFQADGAVGYVVTERGISVLSFGEIDASGAGIAPELTFGSRDVVRDQIIITADGRYAVAPMPSSTELRLIDLATGRETVRDLWALFRFLDEAAWAEFLRAHAVNEPLPEGIPESFFKPRFTSLHYDPENGQLLAVEPDHRAVVRIAIPDGFSVTGPVALQAIPHDVSEVRHMPGTNLVLAYRPELGVSLLSVIDFGLVEATPAPTVPAGQGGADGAGGEAGATSQGGAPSGGGETGMGTTPIQTYELRKGVEGVYVSPDGESAIIRHDRQFGDPNEPGIPLEVRILRSSGHTLLHPATGELKLERTSADIDEVVFSRDGKFAFLLFDDPQPSFPVADQQAVREVHRVDLPRFLTNPIILLDSAPIAGAPVPGQTRVFIAQDHPDGRLTFIDWRTGDVQTVTGFELNSRIRN